MRGGVVPQLPLNPRIAYLPLSVEDLAGIDEPSRGVIEVLAKRREARVRRAAAGIRGDLKCADWEYSVEHRAAKFQNLTLPARSFVALDMVDSSGTVIRG